MKKYNLAVTFIAALLIFIYFNCQQPGTKKAGDSNNIASGNQPPVVYPYDYYVDKSIGSDSNNGLTPSTAFKTITHAVATAAVNKSIKAAPGLYDTANGETFPITLKQEQSLIGDIANKGVGSTATEIRIANNSAAGFLESNSCLVPADNTIIKGFKFNNSYSQLYVCAICKKTSLTFEASNNTFGSNLYGGVYFTDGNLTAQNNYSDASSYAFYIVNSSGTSPILIKNNTISSLTYFPMDIQDGDSHTEISFNTITGAANIGLFIENGTGLIIKNNTFNSSGGYNYGAIYCPNSCPKIRNNTFKCTTAIMIGEISSTNNSANPDIGAPGDSGLNDFSQVTGAAITKNDNNITDVLAIGNTWRNNPPVKNDDIVVAAAGDKVWYGAGLYITNP